MSKFYQNLKGSIREVSASNKCPHCNKPDWCYSLGDEISVCKRNHSPAPGWIALDTQDKEGSTYYLKESAKETREPCRISWEYPDKEGNKFVQVTKVVPGKLKADGTRKEKDFYQSQWNGYKFINGLKGIDRADVPIYRYQEVRQAIAQGIPIIIVEGEACADALWELDLPATTNLGGSKKWCDSDTNCLRDAKIILAPDRDKVGVNHCLKIAENFPDCQWLYTPPSNFFWRTKYLPETKGLDIGDYVKNYNVTREDILALIVPDCPSKLNANLVKLYPKKSTKSDRSSPELELKSTIEVDQPVTLKAQDALFSDGDYISIDEKLYKWHKTYYVLCNQAHEKKRITDWCKSTPVHLAKNKYEYKYAKSSVVEEIWRWILLDFAVDKSKVNPSGINCLNGIVEINYLGNNPIINLIPHAPSKYYTYCAPIEYDPNADEHDCNNLLKALDPDSRIIFLRTMAASLNLGYVRTKLGRGVKALLCQGTGSNGKDTLREAVSMLFSRTMSNATVTDFRQYDQGRKFPLAKLEGSRINWASENSSFANIDTLQSLKIAITGEEIDIELKREIEYTYTPEAVFLFNVNEAPLLSGGMDAIKDRYAILKFNKTFKVNANLEAGELEADPRFRYDPTFLQERVCPALLNKIMNQLPFLLQNGIDYSSCEEDMKAWQRETNHLWEFCQDTGLQYSPGSKIYVSDLWEKLKNWYVESDMLEIEENVQTGKEVLYFGEAPRKGDYLVKASNQLFTRFSKLFPKISKGQESGHHARKKARYILNITFSDQVIEVKHENTTIDQEISNQHPQINTRFSEEQAKSFIASLNWEEISLIQNEMAKYRSPSSHSDTTRLKDVPAPVPETVPEDSQGVPANQNNTCSDNSQETPSTSNQSAAHAPLTVNVNWIQNELKIGDANLTANENTVTTKCNSNPNRAITRVRLRDGKFAQVLDQHEDILKVRVEGTESIKEINIEECAQTWTEEVKSEQLTIT